MSECAKTLPLYVEDPWTGRCVAQPISQMGRCCRKI